MGNIKTYQIIINGIQESINAVESLNTQLNALEARINALASKQVNISTKSTNSTSALNEEGKLVKQIQQTEEKIKATRSESYQQLLAEKDLLKEAVNDQKERAAQERLAAGTYSNTMKGLKEELADIKSVMQTTDLGDEKFKDLVGRAGQLTNKLKELEAEYGQFGRNVGNYASAAEGFKGLKIQVGDTVAEFANARQALKALKQEMQTLSTKNDMGIISEEEAERLKSLIPTVRQLESSIADAGKPMDAIMDAMQSVVAISQTTKGLSALFGLDDDKIERSIQKLVALQNVMQGIQTLQKQMQTGEGLGAVTKSLDDIVEKSKEGTKALKAMGAAASLASKAIKGISKAFGWVAIAMTAIDVVSSLFKKTKEVSDGTVNYLERERKYADGMAASYAKGLTTLMEVNAKIKAFNGNAKDEKKLVDELNKTLGESFGYYKTIAEWKQALIDQSPNYLKMLETEIKLELVRGEIADQMAKIRKLELEAPTPYVQQSLDAERQRLNALLGEFQSVIDALNELRSNVPSGTTVTGKTITKAKNETIDTEKELQNLRLSVMKDGLNKRLMQLDEEKRQTLAKLKKNSQEYLEAEKIYNELRIQEIEKYQSKVNEALSKDREQIEKTSLENQIEEIENYISRLEKNVPKINELLSKNDLQSLLMKGNYQVVMNYLQFLEKALEIGYDNLSDEMKDYIDQVEVHFKSELDTVRSYSDLETASLKDSFKTRINDARDYYILTLDMMTIAVEEERNLREQQLSGQTEAAKRAAAERFKEQRDGYQRDLDAAQEQFDALQAIANEGHTNLTDEQREQWKQSQDIILVNQEYIKQSTENFTKELENIEKEHDNAIVALNLQTFERRNSIQEKYFDTQIANYRDFNSKLNQEIQKQPVIYKGGFEIINISATRKNFKEIQDAVKTVLKGIQEDKNELNEQWNEGLLTPETYSSTLRQLNDIERATTEEFEQISENIKKAWGDWWGSIDQWIHQVGQAATSILSSLSEITSNQYEEQISQQEKYIEEYSDLLDKQKEKTQEYADAVSEIENELSNARGDRRQQLIDNLNAEMAAQRASLAQEKKIEKEKEKADDKRKELEQDKAEAEKRMQIWQAGINAAMAVSMAAVNHWPVPAIPMMAMAAAVGAAQIAAVASKPIPKYGDGGVIQGASHAQGGVRVLGGRAEVEGGEFITNKVTTAKNVDLLEYINTKRRKVDIADLLEFYNSGRPSKNITSIRTKFADGGVIPQLRTDINFNDRLITAFEDYSNRPQYVQVVDIIDQTERLNEVKVISGLEV